MSLAISLAIASANAAFAQTETTADGLESIEIPDWAVCNETSFILDLATVIVPDGKPGAPLQVSGWQAVNPGDCQTIEAQRSTPRFLYAKSANVHQGGVREWKGTQEFCIDTDNFTAKTDIDCALQNLTARPFLRIIPTEHRTILTEPADYGRKAKTAGIQRLLQDNNYKISRIDGIEGRRTNNTLKSFLKANKLDTVMADEQVFDALKTAALKLQETIGLTLCNDTKTRVWSAIAIGMGEEAESKGWWPIQPGACIRPYTRSLKGQSLHYYARQETVADQAASDSILKVQGTSGTQFCIGESVFSAIRQEYCEDQGYVTARFQSLPTDKIGTKITLKPENFTPASVSGLRP